MRPRTFYFNLGFAHEFIRGRAAEQARSRGPKRARPPALDGERAAQPAADDARMGPGCEDMLSLDRSGGTGDDQPRRRAVQAPSGGRAGGGGVGVIGADRGAAGVSRVPSGRGRRRRRRWWSSRWRSRQLMARAVAAGPDEPVTDITLPGEPTGPTSSGSTTTPRRWCSWPGDGTVLGTRTTAGGLMRLAVSPAHGGDRGHARGGAELPRGVSLVVLVISGLWMIVARRRRAADVIGER
jgi:hypothetical protein